MFQGEESKSKSKHSLMPCLSPGGGSLRSSQVPTCTAGPRGPKERCLGTRHGCGLSNHTPGSVQGTWEPLAHLGQQSKGCWGHFLTPPQRARKTGVASQPQHVQGTGKDRGGKQRGSTQQATSWAQLLRHMTMARRILRTGQSRPQLPGTWSAPLCLPSLSTNQKAATCPGCLWPGECWVALENPQGGPRTTRVMCLRPCGQQSSQSCQRPLSKEQTRPRRRCNAGSRW